MATFALNRSSGCGGRRRVRLFRSRGIYRGVFGVLVCLLLFLPYAAFAHHGAHAPADAGASSAAALGAAAAFDSDGRLWVVNVQGGHVVLRHSDDLGKTLSAPVEVNQQAQKIDASRENHPNIAIGAHGEIYVTWVHPLARKWASNVRFARSTDAGKHFSKPIIVHHNRAAITHSFDALAVDASGRVLVAWIDSRGMAAAMARDETYRGLAIYYAWSTDAGKTFGAGHKLVDHSCECCRLALASTPGGHVAAMFRMDYAGDIRDHAFTLLQPGHKPAAPQRVTFSDWKIAACPEQGPGLAIGADGVRHAVWYEAAQGAAIWYGQLQPGHKPQHTLRIGGPGAGHADVAVHGNNVWLVWNQVDANGYKLMARISRDGGKVFAQASAIATSGSAVYSPQLLVHGGDAYAAWNTAGGFRLIQVVTKTEETP